MEINGYRIDFDKSLEMHKKDAIEQITEVIKEHEKWIQQNKSKTIELTEAQLKKLLADIESALVFNDYYIYAPEEIKGIIERVLRKHLR